MRAARLLTDKELKKKKKNRKLHDFLLYLHQSLAPLRKTLRAGAPVPWKIRLLLVIFEAVLHAIFTKREREKMSDATTETDTKP